MKTIDYRDYHQQCNSYSYIYIRDALLSHFHLTKGTALFSMGREKVSVMYCAVSVYFFSEEIRNRIIEVDKL